MPDTPTVTPPTPYRLVGPFEDHLKFNGRAPRTLAEKLQARADLEYSRRTAEIKRLADKLALLEPMLPELAARGVPVHQRDITLYGGCSRGPAVLRIPPVFYTQGADDALHAALLALGFREVERFDFRGQHNDVTLKHGRALLVRITVSHKPAETAAPEIAVREEVSA